MAGRIRTIKPELLEDEAAADLSHIAWRLWVSAFLLADDYGNLRANPRWLSGQVFWGRSRVSIEEVDAALNELATCKGAEGLIILYEVNGQTYAQITGWDRHQRVDKPGKPRCPGPETDGAVRRQTQNSRESREYSRESRESLANIPGSLAPDLRPPTSDPDHRPPSTDLRANSTHKLSTAVAVAGDSVLDDSSKVSVDVQTVYGAWREHHPSATGTLGRNRREFKLIKSRLSEGFSVSDLCRAISGYHRSPWHQGVNEQGRKYLNLELMVRDGPHVQQGLDFDDDQNLEKRATLGKRGLQNAYAGESWVARKKAEAAAVEVNRG